MSKWKIILAAVAAALIGAVIFCCRLDYGMDIPKEYKDFFDYTFAWYKAELVEKTVNYCDNEKYGSRKWRISYASKSAGFGSFEIEASKFFPDIEFSNEKAQYDRMIYDECVSQIEWNAKDEMAYNVLPGCFEQYGMTPYGELVCGDYGVDLEMRVVPPMKTAESLDPENGINVYQTDLKEVACSEDYKICFEVTIERDLDPEKYIAKLEDAFNRLSDYTGTPRNYSFLLYFDTDNAHREKELIYDICDENVER